MIDISYTASFFCDFDFDNEILKVEVCRILQLILYGNRRRKNLI